MTDTPTPTSADVIEGMRWRPIESAPKTGKKILVCAPSKSSTWVDVAAHTAIDKFRKHPWREGHALGPTSHHEPELWMPLPALPDSKPDNQGGA